MNIARPFIPKRVVLPVIFIALAGIDIFLGSYLVLTHQIQEKSVPEISATTPQTAKIELERQPINEGEIYFVETNTLYVFDTKIMEKKPFPLQGFENPDRVNFSRDGVFLFGTQKDNSNDLFMYNMQTKFLKVIKEIGPNAFVADDSTSPNNQYFIVDTGCCPGDSGKILINRHGEILARRFGKSTVWASDSAQLARSEGTYNLGLPAGDGIETSSLYLDRIIGTTVTETLLFEASNQFSYFPVKWENEYTLLYGKLIFTEPFPVDFEENQTNVDWDYWFNIYQTPKVEFYTYDTYTKRSILVDYEKEKITPFDRASYSPSGQWKVFIEGEFPQRTVIVTKADGSEKKVISKGDHAVWRPNAK